MKDRLLHSTGLGLVYSAYAWLLGNAAYVYLAKDGQRSYRVETAAFVFVVLVLTLTLRGPRKRLDSPRQDKVVVPLLLAGAILSILATYAAAIDFPFLSDDYVFLSRYASGALLVERWQFFRPVFEGLFWLLCVVGGGAPWPFHVIALCAHLTNTLFVFLLADKICHSRTPAAIAAMLFALNPLQPEAVLWVSGLQDVLWTGFCLAGLLVYVRHQQLGGRDLTLTLLLVALALGCKETAVCFLLLFPAADWLLFKGNRGRWHFLAYACFVALAVAYIAVRSASVGADDTFLVMPSRYFLKQFVGLPYKTFTQPWSEAVVAVPGWLRFLSVGAAATAVMIPAVRGTMGRLVLAGPVIILIGSIPVYSYFYVSPGLQGSRYLYFPAIGWGLLVGYVVSLMCRSSRAVLLVSTVLLLWCVVSLNVNLSAWHEAARIVRDVQHAPLQDARVRMIDEWRRRYGADLLVRDDIPVEYRGVVIFRNGYQEFLDLARSGFLPR